MGRYNPSAWVMQLSFCSPPVLPPSSVRCATLALRNGITAGMGQIRPPRAVRRNPSGASGNPQIRDSLVAAPRRVGHVPL
jgi:hypothetical protein